MFLFTPAFTEHWSDLPTAPLKIRPYSSSKTRSSADADKLARRI